jgi:hypothetical protein
MRGVTPPLPNTPSWRGAQLKHRGNFTFYLHHLLYAYVSKVVSSLQVLRLKSCIHFPSVYAVPTGSNNSMEQSPVWEAKSHSASQEITRLLCNMMVH